MYCVNCVGLKNLAADALSAGVPSFVVQEEFDRFTGFWWQPSSTAKGLVPCTVLTRTVLIMLDHEKLRGHSRKYTFM